MRSITLEELLEAGCHFGHQVNRRNPKADDYIFEARNNVHIINLENTRDGLENAGTYISSVASRGGRLLIVGTKRQSKTVIEEEVTRAQEAGADGLYYITTRWIGGILTNNGEVSKNFRRYKEIQSVLKKGDRSEFTKKELLLMERELEKLHSFYAGVVDMKGIPDAVFVIDTHAESTAVDEALKMRLPIVGITDTNADPLIIDYPIPSNDDAVGAIKLITNYLIDAWIEGKKKQPKNEEGKEAKDNGSIKTGVKARAAYGSQGSRESSAVSDEKRKQDFKQAQLEAARATGTQSKRMDTKPAVKDQNRELRDKKAKKDK